MINYVTVNKSDIPDNGRGKGGKWRILFDGVSYDESLKFEHKDIQSAKRFVSNILSQLSIKRGTPYKVHTKLIREKGSFNIYVWKEKLN
jgi:hypothetical protein